MVLKRRLSCEAEKPHSCNVLVRYLHSFHSLSAILQSTPHFIACLHDVHERDISENPSTGVRSRPISNLIADLSSPWSNYPFPRIPQQLSNWAIQPTMAASTGTSWKYEIRTDTNQHEYHPEPCVQTTSRSIKTAFFDVLFFIKPRSIQTLSYFTRLSLTKIDM